MKSGREVTLDKLYAKFFKEVPSKSDKKLVGKHIGMRINADDSPIFLRWLFEQSNLSDALRYLVEQEILQSGIRDLSKIIPGKRDITDTLQKRTGVTDIMELISLLSGDFSEQPVAEANPPNVYKSIIHPEQSLSFQQEKRDLEESKEKPAEQSDNDDSEEMTEEEKILANKIGGFF